MPRPRSRADRRYRRTVIRNRFRRILRALGIDYRNPDKRYSKFSEWWWMRYKLGGGEYWSKRAGNPQAVSVASKTLTHRLERREAVNEIRQQLEEVGDL